MKFWTFSLSLLLLSSFSQAQKAVQWKLFIHNDVGDLIPARIAFEENNNQQILHIKNAEETISLTPYKIVDDSTFYRFVDYNATIVFKQLDDKTMEGYWINYENEPIKKRSILAYKSNEKPASNSNLPDLSGKWKATVNNNGRTYNAQVIFRQKDNVLYGTMRTRGGDYRYLEGEVEGSSFFLSSFSGNSVFKLSGTIDNDSFSGQIFGLKTNNISIRANKDEDFELPNEKTLTKVINDKDFQLDLKDENGIRQNFKSITKNKVTIVSIFGTWCPNCVDETDYFQQLTDKFPELEIINVAFEATDDEAEQIKRVKGFKERKKLSIRFLIGGKVGNENVMSKFPMLNSLGIYPTALLIDKKGKIREIHTGFNGPATGIIYDRFKEDYEKQIRLLLSE